jgi:polyhydroxybutyrate depolymerase
MVIRAACLALLIASAVFGLESRTLTLHGVERRYLIALPRVAKVPTPMVLALHGGFGTAESARRFGLEPAADLRGLILVYPQSLNRRWAGAPDLELAYLRAVIEDVSRRDRGDPQRVYATGMAAGAAVLHELACQGLALRAIAPVGALPVTEILAQCAAPPRPLSVLIVGRDPLPALPFWASHNRCLPPKALGAVVLTCPEGVRVEYLTTPEGAPVWPGAIGAQIISFFAALP